MLSGEVAEASAPRANCAWPSLPRDGHFRSRSQRRSLSMFSFFAFIFSRGRAMAGWPEMLQYKLSNDSKIVATGAVILEQQPLQYSRNVH